MTLLDLTEPIFQYVSRLNRLARKSGGAVTSGETTFVSKTAAAAPRAASLDYAVVRSEVKAMFEDFTQKGGSEIRLAGQVKKMELPLLFFVDSMIAEGTLGFAAQWNQNRLAYDRNELAGQEKFRSLVAVTMRSLRAEAIQPQH